MMEAGWEPELKLGLILMEQGRPKLKQKPGLV